MVRERRGIEISQFDVSHGIALPALTGGKNVVATTGGVYYGLRMVATTGDCIVTVYDNASDTTGNIIDYVFVDSSVSLVATSELASGPVAVKNGVNISVTEAGSKGVIFFGPKG